MIVGYFGLPGSGKTTFLTRIAQKELRRIAKGKSKYERVYTIVKVVIKLTLRI